jgi:hypothetical protein
MTAPAHARGVQGKGRYYGRCGNDTCALADIPDPGFMSVTNAQSVIAKPALVPAAAKATAAAAWDRLPMMVATSRQPEGGDLDRHVEAAELTVVSRKHGYAGTGDLWLHLPLAYDQATGVTSFTAWNRRKLWLLDGKSSLKKPANTVYADQPLQLAGLRFAEEAVLPDETVIAVPKFEGGAILNWRREAHALIPQPCGRDVFKAFLGAVELQRLFHSQDVKAWAQVDAPPVPEPTSRKVA